MQVCVDSHSDFCGKYDFGGNGGRRDATNAIFRSGKFWQTQNSSQLIYKKRFLNLNAVYHLKICWPMAKIYISKYLSLMLMFVKNDDDAQRLWWKCRGGLEFGAIWHGAECVCIKKGRNRSVNDGFNNLMNFSPTAIFIHFAKKKTLEFHDKCWSEKKYKKKLWLNVEETKKHAIWPTAETATTNHHCEISGIYIYFFWTIETRENQELVCGGGKKEEKKWNSSTTKLIAFVILQNKCDLFHSKQILLYIFEMKIFWMQMRMKAKKKKTNVWALCMQR